MLPDYYNRRKDETGSSCSTVIRVDGTFVLCQDQMTASVSDMRR